MQRLDLMALNLSNQQIAQELDLHQEKTIFTP